MKHVMIEIYAVNEKGLRVLDLISDLLRLVGVSYSWSEQELEPEDK